MHYAFLGFLLLSSHFGTINATPWSQNGGHPREGLLGTFARNVSASDRRPEPGYPYIPPGPADQRGPCPGLNVLANHGYLPRHGITTIAQAVNASNHVFNMGRDVATYLSTLQVSFSGNLATQTFSIGGEDARTYSRMGLGSVTSGRQWGADAHARIENDNSPTRADFRLNKGDAHSGSGWRFRVLVEAAKRNGGQMDLTAVNDLFAHNVDWSIANTPDFHLDGFQLNGILGAYAFIGTLLPNGTVGAGGTANYESISSLLGFRLNRQGQFCYVPERLPENWYRTTTTFTFGDSFLPIIPTIYNANPYLSNDFGTMLSNASRTAELVCAQFRTLLESIPSALAGSSPARVDAAVDLLHENLVKGLRVDETFGCVTPRPTWNETGLWPLPPFDPKLQTQGQTQRYGTCS